MRYQFTFRNTPGNLLGMALYATYTSFVGIINLVFMIAMGVLCFYCGRRGWRLQAVLAGLGALYFPLIQPLIIYQRMKRNLDKVQEDTRLSFSDSRIYVQVGEKNQEYSWDSVISVEKKPWQVAIYFGPKSGFVIPDSAMKDKKEEFFAFARERAGKR